MKISRITKETDLLTVFPVGSQRNGCAKRSSLYSFNGLLENKVKESMAHVDPLTRQNCEMDARNCDLI